MPHEARNLPYELTLGGLTRFQKHKPPFESVWHRGSGACLDPANRLDIHSTTAGRLSNNDSRKAEHNLVRGGKLCDDPLKIVSHGLSDGTAEMGKI